MLVKIYTDNTGLCCHRFSGLLVISSPPKTMLQQLSLRQVFQSMPGRERLMRSMSGVLSRPLSSLMESH